MKIKNSLQTKIVFFTLISVFALLLVIGLYISIKNIKQTKKDASEYSLLTAANYANMAASYFNGHNNFATLISDNIADLTNDTLVADSVTKQLLLKLAKKHVVYSNIFILWDGAYYSQYKQVNSAWRLISASVTDGILEQNSNNIDQFEQKFGKAIINKTNTVSDIFLRAGEPYFNIVVPITKSTQLLGYFGFSIKLTDFENSLKNIIIKDDITAALIDINGKYFNGIEKKLVLKDINTVYPKLETEHKLSEKIKSNKSDVFLYLTKNDKLLFAINPVIFNNSTIFYTITQLNLNNYISQTKKSLGRSIILAIIGLLLISVIIWRVAQMVTKRVIKLTNTLEELSKGNTNVEIDTSIKTGDELQTMVQSVKNMIEGLQKTQLFAAEIGKGNLDKEHNLLSDKDELGIALLNMRKSLKQNFETEQLRKREEEQRNWATQGIAEFGAILRQDTSNMQKLGFNIMSNLVDYLKVNQGALFVLNDTLDDNPYYELASAIAYNREKVMKKQISVGEGLIGRCVFEKKPIYLKEVPDQYVTITSGLGTSNPRCILIVPCILNDVVYGVIELASFNELQPHEISFVEKLGENIASTISNVRINERTSKLLNDSQKQSEELAAQEEELRQNLEEMEATQEDLQRQMAQNKELQEHMRKQNALLDALLVSLPDYIYFKDLDCKFLRISNSMLSIFNAKSVDEVIGKSDFDYQAADLARKYYNDEQEIIRTRKGFLNMLQKEVTNDGKQLWNSVTKMPLLTAEGEVIGTWGISKDVTEYKNLEIEAIQQAESLKQNLEEMRATQDELKKRDSENQQMHESLMQEKALLDALLTSLPDYIYFKDKESRFIRISDSMLELFSTDKHEDVIGKSDFDFHTPENAQKYFDDEQRIIKLRKGFIDQLQREVKRDGTVIWTSSSKMPLLTKDGQIMGTFGISKNISKLKEVELQANAKAEELEKVNKNNTELKEQIELRWKLMQQLLNELPIKVFIKDDTGKFIVANDKVAAAFGKKAEDIIGKSDFDYYPKRDAQKYFEKEQEIIAKGKPEIFEEGDKDKFDGLIVRTIKKPFKIEHLGVTGLLGLQIDIEELKRGK